MSVISLMSDVTYCKDFDLCYFPFSWWVCFNLLTASFSYGATEYVRRSFLTQKLKCNILEWLQSVAVWWHVLIKRELTELQIQAYAFVLVPNYCSWLVLFLYTYLGSRCLRPVTLWIYADVHTSIEWLTMWRYILKNAIQNETSFKTEMKVLQKLFVVIPGLKMYHVNRNTNHLSFSWPDGYNSWLRSMRINSTSNVRTALPGIVGGEPWVP